MSQIATPNWQELLKFAYEKAKLSPDPSTQNAAVLVDVTGDDYLKMAYDINRFPRNVVMTPERWERPLKYKYVEHAERNVIYQAARLGIATNGLTMICPWAACTDCARAIIEAGIKRLVTHRQAHDRSPEFWKKEIEIAFQDFKEAHVEVVMWSGKVGVDNVLHTGVLWNP